MGIDIKSKLLYGAMYNDIDLEDLEDMVDGGELEYASPHYDSDRARWFVGVDIGNRHENADELLKAIGRAKSEWDELTNGAPGHIRCCAHVF